MKNKRLFYPVIGFILLGITLFIIQIQFPYLPKNRQVEGKIIKTDYASGWGITTSDFPKFTFSVADISSKFQKEGLEVKCNFSKGDVEKRSTSNQELTIDDINCSIDK